MPIMEKTVFDSSQIPVFFPQRIHFTLTATFRVSGRTYVYEDVPQEVYDALIFSDSMGTYFNTHIRDHFRSRET